MPVYTYSAREASGKQVKGKVEAATEREAAALIRERALFLTAITEQKTSDFSFSLNRFRHVSFSDVVNFTRQLSTMITAGLQLPEALSLLKGQSTNSAFVDTLNKIHREIQGGASLGATLAKHPKHFSKSYIALVKAGESSGTLDQVLSRLADNLEKDKEFRGKVRSALTYPVIIITAMIAVFFIMMVVVVPKLTELYEDFGADLPLATRILQAVSDFSVRWWWIMGIAAVLGGRAFSKWRKTPTGRHIVDRVILSLPLLGPLTKQVILVEFTRTLGMLAGAGVHILDALNILVESINNVQYQDAIKDITQKVEKGLSLGVLFAQYPIFPPILAQMVKVGEETGKMDESLIKLSSYFESESDQTIKGLTTAIEPLIMIELGDGVGFIVFAIITPIYNLTSQFK